MIKKIVLVCLALFSGVVFAAPKEIIIMRHADKITGADKSHEYAGRYLSAKGVLRSIKFAVYYPQHFPTPDYIFAAQPAFSHKVSDATSMRPLQTLMPLANLLTTQGKGNVIIHAPYSHSQYGLLAHRLLTEKQYAQKVVLICWQHGVINALAHDLGVKKTLSKWSGRNYDQVYVLRYDTKGQLMDFQILKNQYPIKGAVTWTQLAS